VCANPDSSIGAVVRILENRGPPTPFKFQMSLSHVYSLTRPTLPPTFSGTKIQYHPKSSEALRLGRRQDGSFHLWIKRAGDR